MGWHSLMAANSKPLLVVIILTLSACAENVQPEPTSELGVIRSEKAMPPGFLDEPPPPPTSATAILSGGILLLPDGSEVVDSLVVVSGSPQSCVGSRGWPLAVTEDPLPVAVALHDVVGGQAHLSVVALCDATG